MIDCHNVYRKAHRTEEHQNVPLGYAKTFFHAQQIEACHGQHHAEPDDSRNFLSDENTHQRHQDNVQRRNKSGFSRCRHGDSNLLQGTGYRHYQAAVNAAHQSGPVRKQDGFPICSPGRGLIDSRSGIRIVRHLFLLPDYVNYRNQKEKGQDVPGHVVGVRTHVIHPGTLGHEGTSPDEGR